MTWLLIGLAAACMMYAGPPAHATIQPEMCIEPDIEYPVPCDDDGD